MICLGCNRDLTGEVRLCLWLDNSGQHNPNTDFDCGDYLCSSCATRIYKLRGNWPAMRSDLLLYPNSHTEVGSRPSDARAYAPTEGKPKEAKPYHVKKLVDPNKII